MSDPRDSTVTLRRALQDVRAENRQLRSALRRYLTLAAELLPVLPAPAPICDPDMVVQYATVLAQRRQCLCCNAALARYCGFYCATHLSPQDGGYGTFGTCASCDCPMPLYCSATCARQGRESNA